MSLPGSKQANARLAAPSAAQKLRDQYPDDPTISEFFTRHENLDSLYSIDTRSRAYEDFAKYMFDTLYTSASEHKTELYQLALEKMVEQTKGEAEEVLTRGRRVECANNVENKALTSPHYLMLKSLAVVRLRIKILLDEQKELKTKPSKEEYASRCRREHHLKDRENRLDALLIYHENLKALVKALCRDLRARQPAFSGADDRSSEESTRSHSPQMPQKCSSRASSPVPLANDIPLATQRLLGVKQIVGAVYDFTASVCAELSNLSQFDARKQALSACLSSRTISDQSKIALTTLLGSVSAAGLGLGVGLGIGFALAMFTGPGALLYMVTAGAILGFASGAQNASQFSLRLFQSPDRKTMANLLENGGVVCAPAG